jgi:hypothetical protein
MDTTGHDMTNRASFCFSIIVRDPWQIFAIFISNGGFGTRGRSRLLGISSTSLTISHKVLKYPERALIIKRISSGYITD